MTTQEYYDLLVTTSHEGGFPAVDEDKMQCRYRGPGGRACGVGLILPDHLYSEDMEGDGVEEIVEKVGDAWFPQGMILGDLSSVQSLHDQLAWSPWDHAEFLRELNSLPCFSSVAKVSPRGGGGKNQ